uniref:Uncharacterized protein n=1 Tax=Acrobeloides nanus TaxID=290746 RepID=A0A914CM92_9BILA
MKLLLAIIFVVSTICYADKLAALNQCFVGFTVNGALIGGGVLNVPEDALCLTINATVNTSSISFMGVETTGVCYNLTKINNTGVLHPSCCNTNNCNYPNNGSADYPTPLVCYEGIYYNGTELTKKRDPAVCYGKCARFSAKVNGSSADIYTCSPTKLCASMNMINTCNSVGGIDGCCCDSNVCLDPENNVLTPAPTTTTTTTQPSSTTTTTTTTTQPSSTTTTTTTTTQPPVPQGSASLAISIATLITASVFSLVRI